MSTYPLNRFPDQFVAELQRQLKWFLTIDAVTNSNPDIDGKIWERIVASCNGIPWGFTMAKYDLAAGDVAWSCKTKTKRSKKPITQVEYKAWQFGKREVGDSNLDILAHHIIGCHNANVDSVLAEYKDFRSIVCVRNPALDHFIVYEKPMYKYESTDFIWSRQLSAKANRESDMVIGTNRTTGLKELGISLVDNRLYVWDTIPTDRLVLEAKIGSVDMEAVLKASPTTVTVLERPTAKAVRMIKPWTTADLFED